jgi:hypothetical protein
VTIKPSNRTVIAAFPGKNRPAPRDVVLSADQGATMNNLASIAAALLLLGSSTVLAQPNDKDGISRGDAVRQGRDYNPTQTRDLDDNQRGDTRNDNQRGEPVLNESENQGANHYQKPTAAHTVAKNDKLPARHKIYWHDQQGRSHWRWSTPS